MFKTAIITDEVSQDLGAAIALAEEFHLDGLEIRSVAEKNPFQMTAGDYRRIRRQADEANLAICAVSSPLFKCDIADEGAVAAHMEGLKRAIEGAHILGARTIRGFAFWRGAQATLQRVAERYRPVAELAEREDVVLALESEPSVSTGNLAQLARLLKAIDHPRVRALYDPGNEICDPGAPAPWPAGYELVKPFLAHVHVKDMARRPGGYDPACVGQGEVDFAAIFAALKRDGYAGYASLETHWRLRERMDEALMARPQGGTFSAGGEAASRVCLGVLKERFGFGA